MRDDKKKSLAYSKLRRAIFVRVLIIAAFAVLAVFLFRSLSRGHLADAITDWMSRTFSMGASEANIMYFNIIPNNIEFILAAIIIIFILLLFITLLNSYKNTLMKLLQELAD